MIHKIHKQAEVLKLLFSKKFLQLLDTAHNVKGIVGGEPVGGRGASALVCLVALLKFSSLFLSSFCITRRYRSVSNNLYSPGEWEYLTVDLN